jgi:hypothetical protein
LSDAGVIPLYIKASNSAQYIRMVASQASLVRIKNMSLVLNGLPHARIPCMVIATPFTERFSAAPRSTVGTDCSSAVSALRHGSLAAWHPNVVVSEFNLTVHCSTSAHARSHECQPFSPVQAVALNGELRHFCTLPC